MFKRLATLFGSGDRLVELARSGDWPRFTRALVDADVRIFAALEGEGLDMATMTDDEMLSEIERSAVSLNDATELEPLIYEEKDRRFPFFSNQKAAEMFAGAYISRVGRFFPMQMLEVKGSVVLRYRDFADVFVLNDQSDESFDIATEELVGGA